MKQTKAPGVAPSPQTDSTKPPKYAGKSANTVFLAMALDMTWRLAIVVLVPVIGGFKLDEALDTSPALTLLGFLLAMGGMAYVMWQTLQKANQTTMPKKDNK